MRRHLGLCDRGRTARLAVPYRMRRDLAAVAADLLFPGEYRLPSAEAGELSQLFRRRDACSRVGTQERQQMQTTAP